MKRVLRIAAAVAALAALSSWPTARGQTAQTGSIAFEAHATPTDGRPEPVRQITFYLLRKSYADIQKEAEDAEAKPEMDSFIDGLEVSKELKAWMKKEHRVDLSGDEFLHRVKAADIIAVPEFYDAYLQHNKGYSFMGFPSPKYRESDKEKDPEKYARQKQEYHEAIRKFIVANPKSVEGFEVYLAPVNPAERWAQQRADLQRRLRSRTTQLAQVRYLAGKADTDLNGRATFSGLAPGDYWISTLETEAVAGDVRLRWDVGVAVRAGETTRVELSNLNASEPRRPAQ